MKPIIDVCCGSRIFYFNRENENVVYMDNRELETTLCDGRSLKVKPDVIGDFRDIPFEDEQFYLVVFDPPHLVQAGEKSWLAQKYGKLNRDTWQDDLNKGFIECMRILKQHGTLIFKWNEEQIPLKDVLKCFPQQPLFGNKRAKTHWLVFMK